MAALLSGRVLTRHKSLVASTAAAVLLFAGILGIGLNVYQDFGVSWDEPLQLNLGIANYRYIVRGDPTLLTLPNRYYGPFFQLIMLRLQAQGDPRQMYFTRHLINFATFFAGSIGFYLLVRRLLRSAWMALIGAVILVISPRIFADAFYNSKDIPFLVFYTLSLLTMIWFLDRPDPFRALVHGGMTAAVLTIRLPGLMIPALTIFGLVLEGISRRTSFRRALFTGLEYLVLGSGLCILFWPILWHDPLAGFTNAFSMMSDFPWEGKQLYLGQIVHNGQVPWHYIFVWMGITTPILYLLLFVMGLGASLLRLIGRAEGGISVEKRDMLLVLGAFFGPLVVVIGMQSALYDAWRQMFFIYTPFLLIALWGARWGWSFLRRQISLRVSLGIAALVLVAGLTPTIVWMVENHPHENVYFNLLAGQDEKLIASRFMMDYWGLSYRQGLEYIAETDPSQDIPVFAETAAAPANLDILPREDARRIHFVKDLSQARYFITNYYLNASYPYKDEVYSVRVGDARLLSVFLLRDKKD